MMKDMAKEERVRRKKKFHNKHQQSAPTIGVPSFVSNDGGKSPSPSSRPTKVAAWAPRPKIILTKRQEELSRPRWVRVEDFLT